MKKLKLFESQSEAQGAVEDYIDNFIDGAKEGSKEDIIVDLSQFNGLYDQNEVKEYVEGYSNNKFTTEFSENDICKIINKKVGVSESSESDKCDQLISSITSELDKVKNVVGMDISLRVKDQMNNKLQTILDGLKKVTSSLVGESDNSPIKKSRLNTLMVVIDDWLSFQNSKKDIEAGTKEFGSISSKIRNKKKSVEGFVEEFGKDEVINSLPSEYKSHIEKILES